jgi:sarcosine oxidase/L-pipecolate oxidase
MKLIFFILILLKLLTPYLTENVLLFKLKSFGISGQLLNWFADYLHNRKQCVVIEGVSSSFLNVNSGVPQVSVIGPLLFILYVNDLPEVTKNSTVALFADDRK